MRSYCRALGAALLAVSCAQAFAQVSDQARPVQWHIDGGYSVTSGRTAAFLDNGWTIGSGLTWRPVLDAPFAVRGDLHYSRYSATNELITLGQLATQTQIDDGNGQIVALDVDGVYEVPLGPWARGYVLAGVGLDYRRIELTQTVAVGGYLCDAWWGFCGPGFFPGDLVVDSRSTTRFGWNGGFGVDFPLGGGQSWFIEARFNRMETRRPTEFIPIRIGWRF